MSKKDSRYYFDLPRGWNDQTVYAFYGPEVDGVNHLLLMAIDRNLQFDEIEEFARSKIDPIIQELSGLEVLKDEEVTVEGGRPAWEVVYKWIPGEGVVVYQKYVFVFADDMGFSFSIRFSKKTRQTVGLQVKGLIESLVPGTYEPLEED